jgi:pimeloyl-ACP methyl ester carboxylesterase
VSSRAEPRPSAHTGTAGRYRPSRGLTLGALLTVSSLLALGACSSDPSGPAATTAGTEPEATAPSGSGPAGSRTPPEQFSGSLEEFYEVPDPLVEGDPGQLIRVQDLGESDGYRHLRVMYHSRDAQDQDRAVTGIVSYPQNPAPEGGWPVVATAHGTTGLGTKCAPSRTASAAPDYGIEGVRVMTDYIGMGPVGEVHSYLSGLSEGRSVIDSVRAARLLPEASAGDRWVVVGHSQGGHAALFTHELAEEYAPELDHLGSVVSAPAAVLDKRFGPDDEVVPRMVALMGLYGIAQDHPELDPDDYAGDQLRANDQVVTTGCTQDVIDAFVTIPPDQLYKLNPMDDPGARAVVMANDPATVATDVPMLLLYGDLDWWVVPERVKYLFGQLCDGGQKTELVEVVGADHGNLLAKADQTVTSWLDDRLQGANATDSCPDAA